MQDYSFSDFLTKFDALCSDVNDIKKRLGIKKYSGECQVTPTELAARMGIARSTLYSQPWRMPNFGEGKRVWTEDEIDNWLKTPIAEHKRDYFSRGLRREA